MYQRLGKLTAAVLLLTGLAITAWGALDTNDEGLANRDLGIKVIEGLENRQTEEVSSNQKNQPLNVEEAQETEKRSNL